MFQIDGEPVTPGAACEETPQDLFLHGRKRRHEDISDDRPYVKKPRNAFMIFMKEQRPYVPEELKKKGMAECNKYLGQMVSNSMCSWNLKTWYKFG